MRFADATAFTAGITAVAGALDVAGVPAIAGIPVVAGVSANSLLLLLALRLSLKIFFT